MSSSITGGRAGDIPNLQGDIIKNSLGSEVRERWVLIVPLLLLTYSPKKVLCLDLFISQIRIILAHIAFLRIK